MIKINLLAQQRAKRTPKGQQDIAIGMAVVALLGAVVFLFVHQPMQEEVESKRISNGKIKKRNEVLKKKTKDFEKLEAAFEAAQEQQDAIDRLNAARATPAYLMFELSRILRPDTLPTMTEKTARRVQNNPNQRLTAGWDPKHVWVSSFVEKKGRFTMKGGAQSDGDMTELAQRLTASMYFNDVIPQAGDEAADKRTGVTYYRFTITGRVAY